MKIKSVLFLGVFLIAVMVSVLEPAGVFAYDNNTIHRVINEKAGKNSLILDDYIITRLGYPEGINKTFTGSRIWELLCEGGYAEDEPMTNLRFHFHDPLKDWDNAGFGQPATVGLTGSALLRAQSSTYDYTWAKARDNLYQALTTGSEQSYADTFLDLGHLMHLVSDMAVPAHVRLDPHLTLPTKWTDFMEDPDPYESWTANNSASLTYTGAEVDPAIFSQAITTSESPSPITALWDFDEYNGTNPSITIPGILPPMPGFLPIPVSGPMKIGLAEYTNANFFSKDTIFKNYDNPSYWNTTPIGDGDWLNPETVPGEDGKTDKRVYVWGYVGGNGNIRLAGASLITRDSANAGYVSPPMVIDDNVNKDYASRLVPAAVGYFTSTAGLLFRGDIDSLTTHPAPARQINLKEMC